MTDTTIHQASFVLTSAESKRLIARGVTQSPTIKRALKSGIIAVAKGTTNSYVSEELSGEKIHKTHYCTGTTTPAHPTSDIKTANKLPDLVMRDGEIAEDITATEAVDEMKAGDVFIKGANALNYDLEQAGILIGHPTGGTIGAAIGTVVARKAHLLIPVGLEKSIPGDLNDTAAALAEADKCEKGPALWPVNGIIFTELEALGILCNVAAQPIGAGGILGAEGAVRIAVWGTKEQIERTEDLIGDIQGEPAFGQD